MPLRLCSQVKLVSHPRGATATTSRVSFPAGAAGAYARPPRQGQALVAVGVHRVTVMLRGPHDLVALLAGRVIALSTSYSPLGVAPAARAGDVAGASWTHHVLGPRAIGVW